MKYLRDWPGLMVLVNRAWPLVVSTNGLVSAGQLAGEEPSVLVARTWMLGKRLDVIGVPSAVLTTNCNCVLLRNRGERSFNRGSAGTETSRQRLPLVLRT